MRMTGMTASSSSGIVVCGWVERERWEALEWELHSRELRPSDRVRAVDRVATSTDSAVGDLMSSTAENL